MVDDQTGLLLQHRRVETDDGFVVAFSLGVVDVDFAPADELSKQRP